MSAPPERFHRLGLLLLAFLVFAWAAYRSVAVAVTTHEAFTYNHFVTKPVLEIIFVPWDENNQPLHTLLCHWLLRLFRLSEWSFRLAGLLGLLVYFAAAFRICKMEFPSAVWRTLATAVFVVNPFTVGWLPVSSGHWMASALFLFASASLLSYLDSFRNTTSLVRASCLFGIATGFHFSFFLSCVTAILLISHLNFWESKRFGFWNGVNQLVMPFVLVSFCLWSIPLLNSQKIPLPETAFVVLMPGLALLAVPWLVSHKVMWQFSGGLIVILSVACLLKARPVANHFQIGPEAAMPKVARALRDHLRRSEIRAVRLRASDSLVESANFYRRRYALGAVETIRHDLAPADADFYAITMQDPLRTHLAASSRKIFAFRDIELYEK